ncbi:MAG: hypothetical protein AB2L20_12430 [Mangrovibacterium sp.]
MKTLYIYLISVILIFLFSCVKEGELFTSRELNVVVNARVQTNELSSKASINDLDFRWSSGDKISFFTSENSNIPLTLNEQSANTKEGQFTETINSWQDIKPVYAVYPYNSDGSLYDAENGTYTFSLSDIQKQDCSSQSVKNQSIAPYALMLSKTKTIATSTINLDFNPVMCLLDFNITNAASKRVVKVELVADKAVFATKAIVKFDDLTYTSAVEDRTEKLTIEPTQNSSGDLTLRLTMFPVNLTSSGSGASLFVDVYVEEGSPVIQKVYRFNKAVPTKAYERNTRYTANLDLNSPSSSFNNMPYIPTDPDNTIINSFDENSGVISMTFKNDVPSFTKNSVLVIDSNDGSCIRIVNDFTVNGNNATLSTSEGNMTHLFKNVSFTLTTNPSLVPLTRSGFGSGENVYAPVRIRIDTGNGYKEIYNATAQTKSSANVPIEIFNYTENMAGKEIFKNNYGQMIFEKFDFGAKLHGVFHFDFGEKVVDQFVIGKLKNFQYYLDGNIFADMVLQWISEGAVSQKSDYPIKNDIVKAEFAFPVGPVPILVPVVVSADLKGRYKIEGSGKMEVSGGVSANLNAKLGFSYSTSDGKLKPITTITPTFTVRKPTYTSLLKLDAKAAIFPRINIKFYKFHSGITLWLEPVNYYGFDVSVGQSFAIGEENYVTWNSSYYSEFEADFGAALEIMGVEIAEKGPFEFPIRKDTLYMCPAKIELKEPADGTSLEMDKPVDVTFTVSDENKISHTFYPSTLSVVKFSSLNGGTLKSEYAIADVSGNVTATWTPTGEKPELKATLLRTDGAELSVAKFKPIMENPDRAVLIAFYHSAGGDNWVRKDNWCSDKPLGEWYGIKTNSEGRVTSIQLPSNELTGIADLRKLTILQELNCVELVQSPDNQLTALNVSGCTNLQKLYCDGNELTALNVSGCTKLETLYCNANQLNTLDVSGLNNLQSLSCEQNKLTKIYLSKNPATLFSYTSWGEHDAELYLPPTHADGYQYPQFIYQ